HIPQKNAFSTPIQAVLPPSGPRIIAESGRCHPVSPTWETWLASNVHVATVLPPNARRPTPPPAGTTGVRSCAGPSPLATAIHRPPNLQRPFGAGSRRAAPLH